MKGFRKIHPYDVKQQSKKYKIKDKSHDFSPLKPKLGLNYLSKLYISFYLLNNPNVFEFFVSRG